MSLAQTIENKIRAESKSSFTALQLPGEFIAPNYGGRSIVNVSASIVKILGGQIPTASLDSEIVDHFAQSVRRIVYVIADATGYRRMLDALEGNPQNGFNALLNNGGQLVPITSVFPSTTTAALSAIWSGYTPAEHGFVGYQLFLRDYGLRAEMIGFSPAATKDLGGEQLLSIGLEPEKFLAVPSIAQTLAPVGVPVYNLIEQPYVESALSRVQIRDTQEMHGFVTSSDMWVALRNVIERHRNARALFVAYWSAVDEISHTYGPASEAVIAELNNLAYSFEREFLQRLSARARQGTLFVLAADHGQLDTPSNRAIYLRQHPDLRNRLLMDFAGEARAAYLYCRTGQVDAVREYLAKLHDKLFVVDAPAALKAGLFGSGKISPEVEHRIGDLIVLPRENYFLWDRTEESTMLGRHGGLTEQEMLVPLMLARLDA